MLCKHKLKKKTLYLINTIFFMLFTYQALFIILVWTDNFYLQNKLI